MIRKSREGLAGFLIFLRTDGFLLLIAFALVFFVIALCVVYSKPTQQVSRIPMSSPATFEQQKALLELENATRTNWAQTLHTLSQILGGIAVISGGYIAWRNMRTSEEAQIRERRNQAVELLKSNDPHECQRGVHALEEIARESPSGQQLILQTLVAHVKDRAIWDDTAEGIRPPRPDYI